MSKSAKNDKINDKIDKNINMMYFKNYVKMSKK